MSVRMEKINNEIQKALSNILQNKLKNPNIVSIISVLSTETTPDLKLCKVVLSIFDTDKSRVKQTFDAVISGKGFIKRELARSVLLRQIPDLKFVLSDDIEYGMKISKIIDGLNITEDKSESEDDFE